MPLQIYNTLGRSKEQFSPIDESLVRIYICGPTVYGHMHIGHAKQYISFDIIRRWFTHRYGDDGVLYVMNITDVGHLAGDADEGEDKIEVEARRENRSPYEIAAYYEESFWKDMADLNCLKPDRIAHATDFIRQQVNMVQKLVEKGLAYEANGSVYFDVNEYLSRDLGDDMVPYGGLSNRAIEEQQKSGRIQDNPEKKNPSDFALWKRADESHFMQWYSPWGWGFPGWHIECSAMSQFYLGETFDIHAGGLENQFPHHECEIAQSQGATDKPFVRYWMHNNMVNVGGQKMGKSLGNASNVKELNAQFGPMALRFFIAQSHYRSPLEYDPDAIGAAASGFQRLQGTMERLKKRTATTDLPTLDDVRADEQVGRYLIGFEEAMDDDFNTPVALSHLFEAVSLANRTLSSEPDGDIELMARLHALFEFGFETIMGLDFATDAEGGSTTELTDYLMQFLIQLRAEARARKDFAVADEIRDRLSGYGIILEDSPTGTEWTFSKTAPEES